MQRCEPLIQLQPGCTFILGAGYGTSQPALWCEVSVQPLGTLARDKLQDWLGQVIPGQPALPNGGQEDSVTQALQLVLHWACGLQQLAGLPVFTRAQVLAQTPHHGNFLLRLILPSINSQAAQLALQWAIDSFCSLHAGGRPLLPEVREKAEQCLKQLREFAPAGSNTLRFLRAAHEHGMPWHSLAGNVYEVGQGVHTRWLDSSFTDRTSQIGAGLARDKQSAAHVLRAAGLPVPAHFPVNSVKEALEAAKRLGYPVVVKPMDRDGGVGVAAGLSTPGQVEKAYLAARRYSRKVLVEKHAEGRDYRLTVLNGSLLWAVERQPGGICGDGQHTVAELLSALNADPRRREDVAATLKPLRWNGEAADLLQQAGLTQDSIVPAGQFVRLRRAANVASGGMPVAVMEQVHPHNRQLAEWAARALRLDLAGIDLLIPDISRSWHETGAAICEVNAQPQLGGITAPQIYGDILQRLLGGNGRVPITLLLAQNPAEVGALGSALRHMQGAACGYASEQGVWLGEQRLAPAGTGCFAGGRMLLSHPDCEALVLLATPEAVLLSGLPFDHCDLLVLAGQGQAGALQSEACRVVLPHAAVILCASESLHWRAILSAKAFHQKKTAVWPESELLGAAGQVLTAS